MKLFYVNKNDSRCISRNDGLNLAYLGGPVIMVALPVFAVVLALIF